MTICHPHKGLTKITSVKHTDERFGGILQTIHDVFAITNAASGDGGPDFFQEFAVVLLSKIVVDESAQRRTLGQDLPHRRGEVVAPIARSQTVVLSDQSANWHSPEFVE